MANNRMFLLHKPSGRAVYLGKRMGWGWYDAPGDLGVRVQALFDEVTEMVNESQDDFCIALENADEATLATENWKYTEEEKPVRTLEIL